MLLKHFLKFGIAVFVLIAALWGVGYVKPQYFLVMINLIKPEISSVWQDAQITMSAGTGIASTVLFFLGMAVAIWKM